MCEAASDLRSFRKYYFSTGLVQSHSSYVLKFKWFFLTNKSIWKVEMSKYVTDVYKDVLIYC